MFPERSNTHRRRQVQRRLGGIWCLNRLAANGGLALVINDVLTGVTPIVIDGCPFSRQWIRGGGVTEVLCLFKDPDDRNAVVQPVLPADVWQRMSQILLGEILEIPAAQQAAACLGISLAR